MSSRVFELEAQGFTHLQWKCAGCGVMVLKTFAQVRNQFPDGPVWAMTLKDLSGRLACMACGASAPTVTAVRKPRAPRGGPAATHRGAYDVR